MQTIILAIAITMLCSCTDSSWKNMTTLGDSGVITCYSGGKLIYQGRSTGKITTESQSDGWLFVDQKTNKLVRVSADCVIEN